MISENTCYEVVVTARLKPFYPVFGSTQASARTATRSVNW